MHLSRLCADMAETYMRLVEHADEVAGTKVGEMDREFMHSQKQCKHSG